MMIRLFEFLVPLKNGTEKTGAPLARRGTVIAAEVS